MLIFLGDNIYPNGMPKESDKGYALANKNWKINSISPKTLKEKHCNSGKS
jgi:hypothetical protein